MEDSEIEPLEQNSRSKSSLRKKIEALLFLLLAGLLLAFFYNYQCKEIMVIDGAERLQYLTFSRTVGELVQEKGLSLNEYDKVLPGKEELLQDGDIIVIKRAFSVFLNVDGKSREVWTNASEAAGLLREQGIKLQEDDQIFPALNHPLKPGDEVVVVRVEKQYEVFQEQIPYRTIRVPNSELEKGVVRVLQEGLEGLQEHIWELVKKDGEEVSRALVSSNIISEPQDLILEYGETDINSRSGRNIQIKKVLTVEATAYCPGTPESGCPIDEHGASQCTGFHNDGYTYTGVKAEAGNGTREKPHIIAVDPGLIPLKSVVYIEGYGYARAEDTGSAIKGPAIDLLFNKHAEAVAFGRKKLKVYLLVQ